MRATFRKEFQLFQLFQGQNGEYMKAKMSVEQHQELSKQLTAFRDRLGKLRLDLPYSFNSKASKKLDRLINSLSVFRCEMDSQAAIDLGGEWSATIYYPGSKDESDGTANHQ
jgi:hypothetical protein